MISQVKPDPHMSRDEWMRAIKQVHMIIEQLERLDPAILTEENREVHRQTLDEAYQTLNYFLSFELDVLARRLHVIRRDKQP